MFVKTIPLKNAKKGTFKNMARTALGLSTYARIGSNWEIGRYVKYGGRPQYT